MPDLLNLTRRFLYDQLHPTLSSADVDIDECPNPTVSKVSVFNSAVATFFAPSDEAGIRGMKRERIRCTRSWQNTGPRQDCAFVMDDSSKQGMRALRVVRVKMFFSFTFRGVEYPCALVEWFKTIGLAPDKVTGMWKVKPDIDGTGAARHRSTTVLHMDTFLRGAILLPAHNGSQFMPHDFHHSYTLDVFEAFYVNKYADHHSNEICF